jgi:GT2 family glycosyltransferase
VGLVETTETRVSVHKLFAALLARFSLFLLPFDNMSLAGLIAKAIGLGAIFVVTRYVLSYLQSPLRNIPGPFFAKFSNVWRFINHYEQTHIETQRKLHEQHGGFVRLGPNTVSIADISLIKTIYNTRGTFLKVIEG